jgi:hypothetical protein
MRDTTTIIRPYFRESTDALASLVATRPARDVLLNIAAELTHRERPAARRLASEVAALLGGAASVAFTKEVTLDHPVMAAAIRRAQAVADTLVVPAAAKPARKPAAPKVKRPGDIGWKPRSLDQIARSAGVAPMGWDVDCMMLAGGNAMLGARMLALKAEGWVKGKADKHGYTPWTRGAETLRMGPWGAIYLGASGWVQMARDDRDALTEAGRALLLAEVPKHKAREARNAAKTAARVAFIGVSRFRALIRAGKTSMKPDAARDCLRAKVAYAWKLRAEYRAIVVA